MKMYIIGRLTAFTVFAKKWNKVLYLLSFFIQIVGIWTTLHFYGVVLHPDSSTYIEPAKSFLANGIMYSEGMPILFRTPGYPFILAILYGLFGESNIAVVAVQALMCLASGAMLYSAVQCISNDSLLSLCALYLWTICIMNYYYVCCILTEITFVFFFVMALMWGCKFYIQQKTRNAVFCFLSLNCSLLVRPMMMYLCIAIAAVLFVTAILKKTKWRTFLIYFLIWGIAFGGWSLRNAKYYGTPLFSSVRSISYYQWYAPDTYCIVESAEKEEAVAYFHAQLMKQYPDYDDLALIDQIFAKQDIGQAYVKKHIGAFIIVNLRGLILELIGSGKEMIDGLGLPRFLSYLFYVASSSVALLVYLVYLFGFFKHLKRLTVLDWILLFINVYLIAGHAVLGYSRFRMCFFCSCVLGSLLCWKKGHTKVITFLARRNT